MTWQPFDPPRANSKCGWVSVAAHRRGAKTPAVIIALAWDVAAFLDVEAGSLAAFERGVDDHAGWLRLRKSNNGRGVSANRAGGKQSLRLRVSGDVFGVYEFHSAERLERHEVFRDTDKRGPHVSFELPEWCREVGQ